MSSRVLAIGTSLVVGLTAGTALSGGGGNTPGSELGFGDWTFDSGSSTGTIQVTWDSDEVLAGFQFDLPDVVITGASGGLAEEAGFSINYLDDTVLAFFQTSDGYIYETDGPKVLIELTFAINSDLDVVRFSNVVCSSPDAVALEVTANDKVYLSSPPCPGDFDGDRVVNGADLTVLLGYWGQCNSFDCPGDLNGDSTVDGADLTILLAQWGACR